jgi:glycosyltransferase involved in cell wall biosynthesis
MPPEEQVTEQQARVLYRRRTDAMLLTVSHRPLDFTSSATPAISVIMVQNTGQSGALRPIIDLRAHYPGDIQLILVQSGAADVGIMRHIHGARILHFDGELSFVRACNAALHYVTGDSVLFLGIETELMPNAIAAALRRLTSDQRLGAVGAKLIRGHGRLVSAGGIIWRDGVTQGYLSDASSTAPEGNFVRAVDFCSTDFLLVRASILRELGGFDEELPVGDLPGADLCIRIAAAGYTVLYDPLVLAYQFGHPPAGADATSRNNRGHQHFVRKHLNHLRFRYIPDHRVEVFARSVDHARRVLFIDDTIPMRRIGSGFVRSTDIIQMMATLGCGVTVYPLNVGPFGLESLHADMPDTVEVMHDRDMDGLAAFLGSRQGYYDVIWIARTHNLDRVKPLLDRMTAGTGRPPRIVLDTEAIASLRDAGRAAISDNQDFDLDAAMMREFTNAHACQSIIAVNSAEAQRLRDLGFSDVTIIGHICELRPTAKEFAARAGLLFVGAIHETESPNYDGLNWFIREVLPVVEQSLGWETRLTIAGYFADGISFEHFRDHPRVTLRGPVTDVEKLYASHRIFVAPTRFAAGLPYKVHEAASFGLPVAATELLREQLGWDNGTDVLSADSADPAGFAQNIVTLYRDATLWETLRNHALERIRAENGRDSYAAAIQQAMGE